MSVTSIFNRLFPARYDFFQMLRDQAELNGKTADALNGWLRSGSGADGELLLEHVRKADEVRKNLEKNLVEAFSTPFDRGDIYLLSVSLHKVADYAASTVLSMQAYGEKPDKIIRAMSKKLKKGCIFFSDAMKLLKKTPSESELFVADMRRTHVDIEQLYRDGMAAVFKNGDAMYALKKREIYHHLKDASSNLDDCVDILHRIIVRLT